MSIRSIRNNNPGNLDKGQPWRGLQEPEHMTAEQKAEPRFAVFKAPCWGFRAMAILLRNYERMYGLCTVQDVIRRWAPPIENNTGAYVAAVAKALGVSPTAKLNLQDHDTLAKLIKAIATHETGGWAGLWSDEDLAEGVRMAA